MSDEQEDISHSMTINDELRLYGMTRDDKDDVLLILIFGSGDVVLVPRHDTNLLGCRALWHDTTLSEGFSVVAGPESEHDGTTWHCTIGPQCLKCRA